MPNIAIQIHVLPADAAEGRGGTFLGPPPLVRISKSGGDTVTFKVTPANFTFQIAFSGFSPLNNTAPITDTYPGPFSPIVTGQYHYQVSVTDPATGNRWLLANCPEIGVDL
jgi:hypothetical protein